MSRPILTLGLLLVGCGPADADNSSARDPIETPNAQDTRVEIATLESTDARLDLRLPGEVEGSRDALLASAQGGYIEAVLVHSGQAVRKGQALVRVNTSVLAAQRDQAQARAELAQAELERAEGLGDLASQAQLDGARTQARIAQAQLDLARIQLNRSVITAPFAGVVGQIDLERGEVVGPGKPIARLVNIDPVHVSVSVSDRDVVGLSTGTEVQITTDATVQALTGTLISIDPAADLQTRAFRVKVEVPNPDHRLLPGMIASARVRQTVNTDAVVIPQDWLVTRLDGNGVFIEVDGAAQWRPVQTGAVIGDQVEVLHGLGVGDRVVITGQRYLASGDGLLVARDAICCQGGRPVFDGTADAD